MRSRLTMKSATIYNPAYINMEIAKDIDVGEIFGRWSVDDNIGWRWSGDDESFILGMLRVLKSRASDQFDKELEESDITKDDIKKAILHSINKDPKDGLYSLIGDNNAYLDFQNLADGEYYDREHEIKQCLKNNFLNEEKIDSLADDIIYKALSDVRSSKEIFEEYEQELVKDFKNGKTWRDFVKDSVKACDHHKTAKEFMTCVFEEIMTEEESIIEGYHEKFRNAYYEDYKLDDETITELVEKHDVSDKIISHCGRDIRW